MPEDNESRHNCRVHWIETHGVRLPPPVGGHPALDFCNTWAGWAEEPSPKPGDTRRDWLSGYDELAVWAHRADLVDERTLRALRSAAVADPAAATAVLDDSRALRTLVHDAVLDPGDAERLAAVSAYARSAAAALSLVPCDGRARWDVVDPDVGLRLPLLAVAWSAAELLTSPEVAFVSACPGVECGWLFLDRRGRRRWCDMAVCGNRSKVAAHARRQRSR